MNEDVIFCYAMLSLATVIAAAVAVHRYIRYREAVRKLVTADGGKTFPRKMRVWDTGSCATFELDVFFVFPGGGCLANISGGEYSKFDRYEELPQHPKGGWREKAVTKIRFKRMDFSTYERRRSFAARLAGMFSADPVEPYCVDTGGNSGGKDWRVESGNNWFVLFTGQDTVRITHRYFDDNAVAAMVAWLGVFFQIEEIEND